MVTTASFEIFCNMSELEIIGSINGQPNYLPTQILSLLQSDSENLRIGGDFVGRPETKIYANDSDVVKIRAEINLSAGKAHDWTRNSLKKERELAIHHPQKTWFVYDDSKTDTVLIGSICPRLQPLHIVFKLAPSTEAEHTRYLNIVASMFRQYFELVKRTGHKLDEGLANFAVDKDDNIYYLDDEYYAWDSFISFAVMLGVFIRSYAWLDQDFMRGVSEILVNLIDEIFQDSHCRVIIAGQLKSVFMPAGKKEALVSVVIEVLSSPTDNVKIVAQSSKQSVRKKAKQRYFAVMADIHSNIVALDSVLSFYKKQNIETGIVLGDIVGYGVEPKACIERLRDSPFDIIKGNHDHATATGNTSKGFSENARLAIEWTIEQLNEEERAWLQHLPSSLQEDEWLALHGAPIDPAFFYGYVYLMTAEDNLNHLQDKKIPLCFHGHSHMPGIYAREKQKIIQLSDKKINLSSYSQVLACPGAVGQSRNGTAHAQCAVYDAKENILNLIEVPYDVDAVVSKMQESSLPKALWQRLKIGR